MTQKDFQLIAEVMRDARVSGATKTEAELALLDDVALHFADRLATTNQNFNHARFLSACGVKL